MSGLKWIRLETTIFENPKLLYLKEDKQYKTVVVHLEAMTYSARHSLAGFIPKAALRVIGASTADTTRLVAAALWAPAPGGWSINDWEEFNLSDDDAKKRRERAMKGAAARWGNRNGAKHDDA